MTLTLWLPLKHREGLVLRDADPWVSLPESAIVQSWSGAFLRFHQALQVIALQPGLSENHCWTTLRHVPLESWAQLRGDKEETI